MYRLESLKRAAELGVPVCEQPLMVQIRADEFAGKLGPEAAKNVDRICPLQSFTKEGVPVAFGADVPAFPSHRPLDSIRCAMDRLTAKKRSLDAGEKLSFMEALRVHTLGSAYAAFDEKELGSLEAGKAADFVIWNNDLRAVRTGAEAAELKALATYVGGKAAYGSA